MKTTLLIILFWLFRVVNATGCPLCKKNQPAGFANITHGVGPQNGFDYVMLYGSIGVVLVTLGLLGWYVFRPGQQTVQHTDIQVI